MSETYMTNMSKYAHFAQPTITRLYTWRRWAASSISLRKHARISSFQSLNRLDDIKKRHDVTCVQSIEFYGMLLAGTDTVYQTYCTYGLPPELCVTVNVSYNCDARLEVTHRCLSTLRPLLNSIYIHV